MRPRAAFSCVRVYVWVLFEKTECRRICGIELCEGALNFEFGTDNNLFAGGFRV